MSHAEAQARAISGGLHSSSLGPLYPWAVVGRGLLGAWEVHNLQKGTVIFFGDAVWQGNCSDALGVAGMVLEGLEFMPGYSERPAPPTEHETAVALRRRSDAVVLGALAARPSGRPYAGRSSYDLRATEALGAVDLQAD